LRWESSDLAQARTSSSEVLNQLVSMRELFVGKMRSLILDKLTAEEKARLDQVGKERAALETDLKDLRFRPNKLKDREAARTTATAGCACLEFNVEIQGMDAELVAIEQGYFIRRSAIKRSSPRT